MASSELKQRDQVAPIIRRGHIEGVQVIYNWKILEKSKDVYNFGIITNDLNFLTGLGKKLYVQLQDRFFSPDARNVPKYLLEDSSYEGGLAPQYKTDNGTGGVIGWVAKQWVPQVRQRYQLLLSAMANELDGLIYGINLPETAISVWDEQFNHSQYFDAEMENIRFARSIFNQSHVVQYVNFWPGEWNNSQRYMERMFSMAYHNGIGLGGPDIVPAQAVKKGHMHNAYPFFNKYKGQLKLVAMAVQEPTLNYINSLTKVPFKKFEFIDFAENYLGVDIIFWCMEIELRCT